MKSILSYIMPTQILPVTIYDVVNKKEEKWTPLNQIIVHKQKKVRFELFKASNQLHS